MGSFTENYFGVYFAHTERNLCPRISLCDVQALVPDGSGAFSLGLPMPESAEEIEARRAKGRLYGHRWRKERGEYLRLNPLCAMCSQLGRVVVATVVDHKVPHRMDLNLFWDQTNWQSLCKLCHDAHKQRLEKSGVLNGCGLSGLPLDPLHHWNRRV